VLAEYEWKHQHVPHSMPARSFSYGFSSRQERMSLGTPSKHIKVLDDFELEGVRAVPRWHSCPTFVLIS
ncbi:hypothetical protein SDJN03_00603, partial [Cucurbita argyrosperma subsp. sororia]